jgi:hypothetical protein
MVTIPTSSAASWKTPRILAKALGKWAARDDTRPDPEARAAADEALAAIDATIAELAALRIRLAREIDADAPVTCEIAGEDADPAATSGNGGEDQADEHPLVTGHVFSDAAAELESEGYAPAEAYSILFSAEVNDAYRDDTVTVTMAMDGTIPRYTIAATPEPGRSDAEDQDDTWTDEELAALPPMFPPVQRVGPWPYPVAA